MLLTAPRVNMEPQSIRFENAPKGFDALNRRVPTDPPDLVIHEVTGPHSRAALRADLRHPGEDLTRSFWLC